MNALRKIYVLCIFVMLVIIYFTFIIFRNLGSYHGIDDKNLPYIVWWTPFTGLQNNVKTCQYGTCIFTENRSQIESLQTKAILFYGSDFKIEDLPLPRKTWHWWGLLHEESPKNQPIFDHELSLSLFNLTSTFRQNSGMPLTLQYLQDIESLTSLNYFVPTSIKNSLLKNREISPVFYLQSDCNPPSERDEFVKEISKFIAIDSYGSCLNNKPLPSHLKGIESMNHPEVLKLMAKYKFTLALENSACEDYITEKLWRPLSVGSVPIYWGSPSVEKWMPNNRSIVHVRDFNKPQDLVFHLLNILSNDSLYENYLKHKLFENVSNKFLVDTLQSRNWGINEDQENKGTFVEAFECFVCDQIFKFHNSSKPGTLIADKDHYGCPSPEVVFPRSKRKGFWVEQWHKAEAEAYVLNNLINTPPGTFSSKIFYEMVISYLENADYFKRFKQDEL